MIFEGINLNSESMMVGTGESGSRGWLGFTIHTRHRAALMRESIFALHDFLLRL